MGPFAYLVVFFSILINGMPSSTFSPSRGIRQGDMLSPFLFILMAEGLGHMLKFDLATGNNIGISIHDNAPCTHQQFTDDNLLFGHPLVQEARLLKKVLELFSKASGTSINP